MKKNNYIYIYYIFVILSFLFPRGILEISMPIKMIYTVCIWLSCFFIAIDFINAYLKKDIKITNIFLYFIYTIIITFMVRIKVTNGFQQLFSYPAIFVFILLNFKKNSKFILEIIINYLIILFTLNILVNNVLFTNMEHINFLGHVQMVSQVGTLAIFSILLYNELYEMPKKRIIIFLSIIFLNLIFTDALTSKVASIVLIFYLISKRNNKIKNILSNPRDILKYAILFGAIITIIVLTNIMVLNNYFKFLAFSGRNFIWKESLILFLKKPLFGYGSYGVYLKPFWVSQNDLGFNYAHSQYMQCLLDGGIVSLFLYYDYLRIISNKINYIKNYNIKYLSNICFLTYMLIMIVESTNLYCYFFIFTAIIYMIPNMKNKEIQ